MRAVPLIALLLAAAPATAHASSWTPVKSFRGAASDESAVPRAAITASGVSTVAWRRGDHRLAMTTGTSGGRFRAPKAIARSAFDFAVAPGAVAYEAKDGIHVYTRGRDRRVTASSGEEINGVAIAADPLGGYVIAERQFRARSYRVRAMSVDADGRLAGAVQDLGLGQFGIDARPTQSLSVLPDGRALLVFERESPNYTDPTPGVLSARPHGGAFAEPAVVGAGLTDPRITGSPRTVTRPSPCGRPGRRPGPASLPLNSDNP